MEYKHVSVILLMLFNLAGCQEDSKKTSARYEAPMYQNMTSKDVKLLFGDKNMKTDSLPESIRRLKFEISKGKKVYTPDELKTLERKLADYENQYRVIQHP